MKIDIKKAFMRVFEDKALLKKLAILFVLSFISAILGNLKVPLLYQLLAYTIFLITSSITSGYMYKYLNLLMSDQNNFLPEWNNIKELFIIGIKPILAGIIYSFIFAVALILSAEVPGVAKHVLFGSTIILSSLLLLTFMYGLTIAYCEEYKFKALFNFKKAASYFSGQYALTILIAVALTIVCSLLFWMFNAIKLGTFVSVIAGIYFSLIINNLLAQVYHYKKSSQDEIPNAM